MQTGCRASTVPDGRNLEEKEAPLLSIRGFVSTIRNISGCGVGPVMSLDGAGRGTASKRKSPRMDIGLLVPLGGRLRISAPVSSPASRQSIGSSAVCLTGRSLPAASGLRSFIASALGSALQPVCARRGACRGGSHDELARSRRWRVGAAGRRSAWGKTPLVGCRPIAAWTSSGSICPTVVEPRRQWPELSSLSTQPSRPMPMPRPGSIASRVDSSLSGAAWAPSEIPTVNDGSKTEIPLHAARRGLEGMFA